MKTNLFMGLSLTEDQGELWCNDFFFLVPPTNAARAELRYGYAHRYSRITEMSWPVSPPSKQSHAK